MNVCRYTIGHVPEHDITQMSDLFLPHLREMCGERLSEEQLLERIRGDTFLKVDQELAMGKVPIGDAGHVQRFDRRDRRLPQLADVWHR